MRSVTGLYTRILGLGSTKKVPSRIYITVASLVTGYMLKVEDKGRDG
jgi:hypothetical protein